MYAHLLMRPYETVTLRGVRVKRIEGVRALGTGEALKFRTRSSIPDMMFNPDPAGELTVTVPESAVDEYATVLAIDFAEGPVGKPRR